MSVIPAAAGGPKGLILGPLDRHLFTEWLPASSQPVHLVGASIGAWRMATACLPDPGPAFQRLERDYISQDYDLPPGRRLPTPEHASEVFGRNLRGFYGDAVPALIRHPRFRLHIMASRGRHLLAREQRLRTALGYAGAFVSNTVHRRAMGLWLERVVFSSPGAALPFSPRDFPTRQVGLNPENFAPALQASCSIPFMLRAVHDIPGAPRGAYWDGGITDYHLHLDYLSAHGGLVLYPHFQRAVVPGWLDKALKWRHRPTRFLENMVVLAPDPSWVRSLPGGKLPDRNDFVRFGRDLAARVRAWSAAVSAAQQLADEFAAWVERPHPDQVEAL